MLKQLRSADDSKKAWSRILERGLPESVRQEYKLDVKTINYDTLRLGRVRLDAFCMELWRQLFHKFKAAGVRIYLFTDGSPQWRGVELRPRTGTRAEEQVCAITRITKTI